MRCALLSPAVILASAYPAAAAQTASIEGGAYEVHASLELPNVEDMDATNVKTLCLTSEGGANNHGFAVLSENNPLSHCPMKNISETGGTLSFDIKCTGSNLARATARYLLMRDRFRGRIAMTMGGKNMTMTEVQEGHRIGACAPPS